MPETGETELTEPPLRLTIEGLRWTGEEFDRMGDEPAGLTLHGTDGGSTEGQILRLLRSHASGNLSIQIGLAYMTHDRLDFDAPNGPTEDDIGDLIGHLERALATAKVLKQLAPEITIEHPEDDEEEK